MSRLAPVREAEALDAIRYVVCAYCINRATDVCIERCVPEGLYRYLEPAELEEWEFPPDLPPFRELLQYDAVTRLALFRLAFHYVRREIVEKIPPRYR